MGKGFETEAVARERAAKDMPNKHVVIIESRGEFFVEPSDDAPMIRAWEAEVFSGLGKNAKPKKGWSTCQRCGTFVSYDKGYQCRRCGAEVGAVPPSAGL